MNSRPGVVRYAPCVDGSPLARVFLMQCAFGGCGHVFDLLVRRAWPLAIMPFAEPGPDQKHALWGALAQLGFPGSRYLLLAHYIASALPNLPCAYAAADAGLGSL